MLQWETTIHAGIVQIYPSQPDLAGTLERDELLAELERDCEEAGAILDEIGFEVPEDEL